LITEGEDTDVEEATEAVVVDTEEVEVVVVVEEDITAEEVAVVQVKIRGEVDPEPMVRILLRLRRHNLHENWVFFLEYCICMLIVLLCSIPRQQRSSNIGM